MKNRRGGRQPDRRGRKGARLHSTLARRIGEQILSGAYPPGALLPNEAEWCRHYGASRTAVREAIKGLNAKGLLVSRPKVGSRVEPRERWNMLDRDLLAWAFAVGDKRELLMAVQEVRRVIEPEVAALAAHKRSAQQVEAIRTALAAMSEAAEPAAFVEPDLQFHLGVLEAANNPLLSPFGGLIESALRNLFAFTTHTRYEPELVIPLHRNILKAIEKGSAEAARRAVKVLLEDTDNILQARPRPAKKAPARRRARPLEPAT